MENRGLYRRKRKGLSGRCKFYINFWIENQDNNDSRFQDFRARNGKLLCMRLFHTASVWRYFFVFAFFGIDSFAIVGWDGIESDWITKGGDGTISREAEV